MSSTTIIIPTLNEEENIGRLIDQLLLLHPKIKIIVTDDGSKDNTRHIAEQHGATVINRSFAKVKGISAAVLDAAKTTTNGNIVVMDADFQHPPEKVKDIIEALSSNDIVIAARTRVIGPWGPVRHLESIVATALARLRVGKVRDPLSGFFGVKKELFKKIKKDNFELRCFKILVNILKNAKGLKIGYVPYEFDIRKRGQSKIQKKHIWYFLKNIFS
jgi:dolichol-phosphate mannosyltransferase